LLLRRSPDGAVTTLAGSAYDHADGKGSAARFSSVGGMAFGPDGSLYVTDGTAVRKITLDGTATTVAKELNFKTSEDKPTLFGGAYGSLAGLAVDSSGTVYVADAGNRRLLKLSSGIVEVVYRAEPPFFPNGVVVAPSGDIYVLEVGFALPSTWSGPRVRKLSADGKQAIVAVAGAEPPIRIKAAIAERAGASTESVIEFFYLGGRMKYVLLLVSLAVFVFTLAIWKRTRRQTPT
jgi:hypothetical protein